MQSKNLKAINGGFMRLGEQIGYKVFDHNNISLSFPTESMTVSDIIQMLERLAGLKFFTQAVSEKEILLWSEYGFENNSKSSVIFKLIGNPKTCCSG
jgi:hypothetical protein